VTLREFRLWACGSWYRIARIDGVLEVSFRISKTPCLHENVELNKGVTIYPQTVARHASCELRPRLSGLRKLFPAKFWQLEAPRSVLFRLEKRIFLLHALLARPGIDASTTCSVVPILAVHPTSRGVRDPLCRSHTAVSYETSGQQRV
jgi:hypothetical protein